MQDYDNKYDQLLTDLLLDDKQKLEHERARREQEARQREQELNQEFEDLEQQE